MQSIVDFGFSGRGDRNRVIGVDATPVPAPPTSRYPGEHLCVNCHYDIGMAGLPPAKRLEQARDDAAAIVRQLSARPEIRNYVAILVTVYGHFPAPGAARPPRRRIYRVSILTNDIPAYSSLITPEFFALHRADESSELDDVAELLQHAAN
jgi:hypothetical protein